jgi:hypothetical protein
MAAIRLYNFRRVLSLNRVRSNPDGVSAMVSEILEPLAVPVVAHERPVRTALQACQLQLPLGAVDLRHGFRHGRAPLGGLPRQVGGRGRRQIRRHRFLFQGLLLIPAERHARMAEASIQWNYTTILNIVFVAIAALLIWRFFTTGGPGMMAEMDKPRGRG